MAAQVLIDGEGKFNQNVERQLNLVDKKSRVTAVSIVGVQNTGKSTLMNELFNTSFQVMAPGAAPNRVTKGAMIAVGESTQDYKILVIDTEGSDRDGGDESFEKKIRLFAISIAETVIFYMKCENVGLRGETPLMEHVLEAMLRIQTITTEREKCLLFVLRDRTECSVDTLTLTLTKQLQRIWDALQKPRDLVHAKLEDYFTIDVVAMPHYKHEKNEFDSEVISLREKINSLVQPSGQLDTPSSFIHLAESNWNNIKDDKILNVSLNRMEMAKVRCINSYAKKIDELNKNLRWIQFEKDIRIQIEKGTLESGKFLEVAKSFGNEVRTIIGDYISQYDEETLSLDETHRSEYRELLLTAVKPAYDSLVEMAMKNTSSNYEKKIVEQIKQGSSTFEGIDDEFISQYKTVMKDIRIQQASWAAVDGEQLERLKSTLASMKKGGLYILTQRGEIKGLKKDLIATTIAVSVLAAIGVGICGAVGVVAVNGYLAATAAVETFGSVPAVIAAVEAYEVATNVSVVASAGIGLDLLAGFKTLMPVFSNYSNSKTKFVETCRQDPIIWSIYLQVREEEN